MNYTYIVRCKDDTLYCGWTNNLEKRVACHNAGKFVIIFSMKPDAAHGYFEQGYDSVTTGIDVNYYIESLKAAAQKAKE